MNACVTCCWTLTAPVAVRAWTCSYDDGLVPGASGHGLVSVGGEPFNAQRDYMLATTRWDVRSNPALAAYVAACAAHRLLEAPFCQRTLAAVTLERAGSHCSAPVSRTLRATGAHVCVWLCLWVGHVADAATGTCRHFKAHPEALAPRDEDPHVISLLRPQLESLGLHKAV